MSHAYSLQTNATLRAYKFRARNGSRIVNNAVMQVCDASCLMSATHLGGVVAVLFSGPSGIPLKKAAQSDTSRKGVMSSASHLNALASGCLGTSDAELPAGRCARRLQRRTCSHHSKRLRQLNSCLCVCVGVCVWCVCVCAGVCVCVVCVCVRAWCVVCVCVCLFVGCGLTLPPPNLVIWIVVWRLEGSVSFTLCQSQGFKSPHYQLCVSMCLRLEGNQRETNRTASYYPPTTGDLLSLCVIE